MGYLSLYLSYCIIILMYCIYAVHFVFLVVLVGMLGLCVGKFWPKGPCCWAVWLGGLTWEPCGEVRCGMFGVGVNM